MTPRFGLLRSSQRKPVAGKADCGASILRFRPCSAAANAEDGARERKARRKDSDPR